MSREYYLAHPQDIKDMCDDLKERVLPMHVHADSAVPDKTEHPDEYAKRLRMMSYFHRTICVEFGKAAGVGEEEAKYTLLSKFGAVNEIVKSESGEWDVVSIVNGKMFVFNDNTHHEVRPISDMPNNELSEFINQCKDYLLQNYGVMVTNFNKKYKTK